MLFGGSNMERIQKSSSVFVSMLFLTFLIIINVNGSNSITVGMGGSQTRLTHFAMQGEVTRGNSAFRQGEVDWVMLTPSLRPPGCGYHGMAFDAESNVLVLHGGFDMNTRAEYNDTWTFSLDSNNWVNQNPTPRPPSGNAMTSMAYDSKNDLVVLFGGSFNNSEVLGDTWIYDYNSNTWTNVTPSFSPPPRDAHAVAYDSQSERIIVFGGRARLTESVVSGYNESDFLHDVWSYNVDTNTWTNVTPAEGPTGRFFHGLAYDSKADCVLLFGGQTYEIFSIGTDFAGVMGDTWAFDLEAGTWTNRTPAISPGPRSYTVMTYDASADYTILYAGSLGAGGGAYNDILYGDTWAYNYNTNTWTEMNSPSSAGTRMRHAMAYNNVSSLSIMFGGQIHTEGSAPTAETWTYTYQLNPPSAPRNLSVSIGEAALNLEWLAPRTDAGSPISGYSVYRGTLSGDLSLLIELDNVLAYSDAAVTAGVTYYYVVRAVNGIGESAASNEVNAIIPLQLPILPILIGGGVVALVLVIVVIVYLKKRS
jgi:hypothetical protein